MNKKLKKHPYGWFPVLAKKTTFTFHSLLLNCGHGFETKQSYRWNGLEREDRDRVIFQYTLNGWGILEYENKTYEIHPGQAFLVSVPHNHCYYLPQNSTSWEFVYLTMSGPEISRIQKEIVGKFEPVIPIRPNSAVLHTMNEIFDIIADVEPNSQYEFSALAYKFSMYLLQEVEPRFQIVEPPSLIQKAKQFCIDHLSENISVNDIAEYVGYSRYHFSRIFIKTEGIGPKAYLEHLRFRKALDLLLTKDIPIHAVSSECGFQDVNYFCKVFRKNTGISPGVYRRQYQVRV